MILSITFKFAYNKKYINEDLKIHGLYGQATTHDFENTLKRDIDFLNKIDTVIEKLNADLSDRADVLGILYEVFGLEGVNNAMRITEKSILERTYSIGGLYIHEKDPKQKPIPNSYD